MSYYLKKEVNLDFWEAVKKAKEELLKEGFGVLTEVNVRETLKKKLGEEFEDYIILGACNPPLAFKALKSEIDVGLLLPCNVVVYSDGGKVFVSAIMPTVAMGMVDNESLREVALEVEGKLKRVINSI